MAKKSAPTPDPKNVLALEVSDWGGKSPERIMAEVSQSPTAANTVTARAFAAGTFGAVGLTDAMAAMREKVGRVKSGNMEEMEALLVAQARNCFPA